MPSSFDMSADYADSVEDVYRAFSQPDYWRERLVYSAADDWDLERMQVADDHTIQVVMVQTMFDGNLPAVVTQLHKGNLVFRRTEVWGPLIDGASRGTLDAKIPGAPVTLSGITELSPNADGGARLRLQAEVHVRIPIIGGKVEKLLGAQIPAMLQAEQQFTEAWIKDHA